jgi:hypothetical protein
MPRLAFSPKSIKARIDDFVVAQNRAKRILSTAMHNQRLRIQQLEQYQRDLLSDEREHAERLRREAATHQNNDPSSEVLTDFEGQSEGYPPTISNMAKRYTPNA